MNDIARFGRLTVRLSNTGKVFFPADGITKGEVFDLDPPGPSAFAVARELALRLRDLFGREGDASKRPEGERETGRAGGARRRLDRGGRDE